MKNAFPPTYTCEGKESIQNQPKIARRTTV